MNWQQTQKYQPRDEDEAMNLGDVLVPDDQEGRYEDQPYDLYQDNDSYILDDQYSDYHEELDIAGRFKVAIGVFDMVSILVGVLVIFVLVTLLFSLFNWLRSDILHSVVLLQSGLQ